MAFANRLPQSSHVSPLQVLECVFVSHCAYCCTSIAKAAVEQMFVKKTALPKVLRSA